MFGFVFELLELFADDARLDLALKVWVKSLIYGSVPSFISGWYADKRVGSSSDV
jgi:hypothetical protein